MSGGSNLRGENQSIWFFRAPCRQIRGQASPWGQKLDDLRSISGQVCLAKKPFFSSDGRPSAMRGAALCVPPWVSRRRGNYCFISHGPGREQRRNFADRRRKTVQQQVAFEQEVVPFLFPSCPNFASRTFSGEQPSFYAGRGIPGAWGDVPIAYIGKSGTLRMHSCELHCGIFLCESAAAARCA